jgi:uncharacterized membrane protein HdeD (DUF308 family)
MSALDNPIYRTARRWVLFLAAGSVFLFAGIWVFLHADDKLFEIDALLRYIILVLGVGQLILSVLISKSSAETWWNRIVGLLEIVLGVYLILAPGRSVFFAALLIGFWLLVRGLFLIGYAYRFRQVNYSPWFWTMIGGIVMLVLSYFIVQNPLKESVTYLFWVALNMILAGLFHILLSFKLRALHRMHKREVKQAAEATG